MGDPNNLIILQKMYDFYLWFYSAIGYYPKHEKFALATKTKQSCIEIMTLIIKANKVQNRKMILFEVDTVLEQLRLLIRLAKDLKYISIKKYGLISQKLTEIGRLLGGWMRVS